MLTSNVLKRVFQIGWQDSTGTGFTIEHKGRQYFLTARHVVEGFSGGELDFFDGLTFSPRRLDVIGMSAKEADIAVLASDSALSATFPMPATDKGMVLGQKAFFLGFPYGYAQSFSNGKSQFGALPLVKSASISAFNIDGNLVLDGHNNPGFSGGPVVFVPANENNGQFSVGGIVTSYPSFGEPVVDRDGVETGDFVGMNPGIVFATSIHEAIKIIEGNPNGFPLSI